MRPIWMIALSCLLIPGGQCTEVEVEEEETYFELSLEQLLKLTIVSATRSEAKLNESPIPISVITSQDIAKSGLTSIPEILARLSEVDVLRIGKSQTEVSIRGKGINFNRRLLVLIDGRTEYNDLFGVTLWDAFPININDIDRIEVVRGPASALFGANAFSGAINIITKPIDSGLTELQLIGGSHNTTSGQLRFTRIRGDFAMKITAGLDRADSYQTDVPFEGFNGFPTSMSLDPDDESLKKTKGNLLLTYSPSEKLSFKLSAGISDGTQELFPQPGLPRADWDIKSSNLQVSADYHPSDSGTWQLNAYRNRFDYQTALLPDANDLLGLDMEDGHFFFPALNQPRNFNSQVDTTNLSLQYVGKSSGGKLNYVVGAESRRIENQSKDAANAGLVTDSKKEIESLFGNMTFKFGKDHWQGALGYRYDDDSLTDGDYGYTAALSYFPNDLHSLRVTSRRAFRAPSLFEMFADVLMNVPSQNHSVRFLGNTELVDEEIESLDLTYNGQFGAKFQCSFELYDETYRNLIGNPDSGLLDDIDFDDITQQFTTTTTFRNLAGASSRGLQATMLYHHSETLNISAGYGFNDPKGLNDLSGETFYSPEHKLNFGLTWRPMPALMVVLENQYVGKTDEEELVDANFTRENQQAYNLLNLNLRFTFPNYDNLTLILTGSNILDDNFVAYHEFDPVLNGVGEGFGREINGGLQWRF